mmetsp:Transcript_42306/g.89537  ORF Transcript_42306/g.89537 Transcript_42306/m.89537 type:complete len:501 (+) Transcript_42306:57-1559(+)
MLVPFLSILAVAHPNSHDYGIIIDAGSTGSRIHLFHWPKRIFYARQWPFILGGHLSIPEEIANFTVRPGLSAFAGGREGQAGASLQPLLDSVSEVLLGMDPPVNLHTVPLFLGATGGCRLLSDDTLHLIMGSVREVIFASPFDRKYVGRARVLSGEEEGVFGWLAVNAGRGTITSDKNATLGVVDLGGASSQITFIPTMTSIKANLFPMHFGDFLTNGPIHVYSHSYLGFGYVTAFQRVAAALSVTSPNASEFVSPCLPVGVSWQVSAPGYGISVRREVTRTGGPISMSGSGDFDWCHNTARALLPSGPCFFNGQCSFLGQYQPPMDELKFAAIGEFQATFQAVGASSGSSLEELRNLAERFCALPFAQQAAVVNGTQFAGNKAPLLCWSLVWTLTLLVDGFQLPWDSRALVWDSDLWGGAADWARGQMLYEVNFFPWEVKGVTHKEQLVPVVQAEAPVLASLVWAPAGLLSFVVAVLLGRVWERRSHGAEAPSEGYAVL